MLFNDIDLSKAELQKIKLPGVENQPEIFLLRLDLIHPLVHGNKFFKMKYNLLEAEKNNFDTLLTFGGAYSNHIHATAAAGKIFGFKIIGIIRGEEHLPLNPTLQFAADNGMKLIYVPRSDYRKKHTEDFLNRIKNQFGNVFIIPEGGTNMLALKGCAEIPGLIKADYDCLCTACGTSGTLSGIVAGLSGSKKVIGFSVLKGGGFLKESTENLVFNFTQKNFSNWSINTDYHFGGYAKINLELVNFLIEFEKLNKITLDPVYTGKMMYGVFDFARKNYFEKEEKIIALHTGGLQGLAGMKNKIAGLLKNQSS
jgi:1-aminocyclopropane-1-carboxylate deaminase/D-cysteine desulfhydrase-like pyridoxal-dependent ACC family enzyme